MKGKHLICGGKDSDLYYNECYRITKLSTILVMEMKSKTVYASGIVVDYIKFWMLGGKSCDRCILKSTEYLLIGDGSYSGPDLPIKMYGHVITALNSTTYIITGGSDSEDQCEYVGDGYCDDGSNYAGCNYDGGDCCPGSNSPSNWDCLLYTSPSPRD